MMLKVMARPEPMALLKVRTFRCAVERFFIICGLQPARSEAEFVESLD
jgi:hypothetical protein